MLTQWRLCDTETSNIKRMGQILLFSARKGGWTETQCYLVLMFNCNIKQTQSKVEDSSPSPPCCIKQGLLKQQSIHSPP